MVYSAGCEYAIRAVAELARHWPDKQYVLLRSVASGTNLAGPYLGKLLQRLVLAGMVQSLKGRTGGYRLAKDPRKIRLIDIVKAIDGTERLNRSIVGLGDWRDEDAPAKLRNWAKLRGQVLTLIEKTTAADLAEAIEHRRAGRGSRRRHPSRAA